MVTAAPQTAARTTTANVRLRLVFFGTPDFAVPSLDALLLSHHQVVAVVTQPDRPRGRGQKTTDAPVKARAIEAGIPVFQPDRLKDLAFLDSLTALRSDLGVVAAYGKILTEAVLASPRLGMINVHASLLPKYRGAAPVHRAIIAGETETGVTIMRVVKALDAGPMLATARRPIGPNDTSDVVERDLAKLGASLLAWVVDWFAENRVEETPQHESAATYAHRLTKADGLIDWTRSPRDVHNRIRGLHPWPHAFTYLGGHRLILLRSSTDDAGAQKGAPGSILEATGDRLVVAVGTGALRLLQVQAEGKRPMTVREFMAGHHVAAGDRFTSPP